jgi:hypothetical protein
MLRPRRWLLLAPLLLLGCGDDPTPPPPPAPVVPSFTGLSFSDASKPKGDASFSSELIELRVGIAVKVRVSARYSDGSVTEGSVSMQSVDLGVVNVSPGPSTGDLVFEAVQVGKTFLEVSVGGKKVNNINVTVF